MPAKTRLIVGHKADKGLSRDVMEDSYGFRSGLNPDVLRKGALFIVADGVGGNQDGELASRMAVEIVTREYYNSAGQSVGAILEQSIIKANMQIYAAARNSNSDMATTIVCGAIYDGSLTISHVGDSRAYLLRGKELLQLTQDHSLVNDQVRQGLLKTEEAQTSPFRNVITRSLGNKPEVVPETNACGLVQEGDRLLLCSDGLYDVVPPEKIRELIAGNSPSEASEKLVDLANAAGGNDNISVIVVEMHPEAILESQPLSSEGAKTDSSPVSESWAPPNTEMIPFSEQEKTYVYSSAIPVPFTEEGFKLSAAIPAVPEGAGLVYQWTLELDLAEVLERGDWLQKQVNLPGGRTVRCWMNAVRPNGFPTRVLIRLKIDDKEINRLLTSYEIIIDAKNGEIQEHRRELVYAQEGEIIAFRASDPRIFALIQQATLANPAATRREPAGFASLNVIIFVQIELQS